VTGGYIITIKESHAIRLSFTSIKYPKWGGVPLGVTLINGHLITPKLYQFNLIINWLKEEHGYNYTCSTVDTYNVLSNAWFYGFIDAEGSFAIHMIYKNRDIWLRSGKNRVEIYWRLEPMTRHKVNAKYFEPICQSICQALLVELGTSQHIINNII
jgi:hypothetical protein